MDKRKLFAGGFWPLALMLVAPVHSAQFNAQMRAPAASAARLPEKIQQHFDTVKEKQGERFIRDGASFQQWVDLQWTMEHQLAEGAEISRGADLARFGLIQQSDGSYIVRTKDFPQWRSLVAAIVLLAHSSGVESFAPALEARGFRAQDIDTIREYVRTNSLDAAAFSEHKELVQTFAKRAPQAGQSDVMAFLYQGMRIRREQERQWAIGLLDALDAQRRRALTSYLMEELDSVLVFGPPEPPHQLDQRINETLRPLISGEYQRQLDQAEAKLREDAR